jgi:hypothetical protein
LRCPFHEERSPSCHLIAADARFKCYGCGQFGDVFDILGQLLGKGLQETLDWASEATGIQRPSRSPEAEALSRSIGSIRDAIIEGREVSATPPPFGIDLALAARLGLGRAVGLGAVVAGLPRAVVTQREAADWEGSWVVTLYGRSGIAGFGALVHTHSGAADDSGLEYGEYEEGSEDSSPEGEYGGDGVDDSVLENGLTVPAIVDDASLVFAPASAIRNVAFVAWPVAREIVEKFKTIYVTPDVPECLRLQAQGSFGAVSAGRSIDDAVAAALAERAPHVVLITTAARRAAPGYRADLLRLVRTGVRVSIADVRPDGLGPPAPLFRFMARAAARDPKSGSAALRDFLAAVPSNSTRALYEAELKSTGLLV